MPKYNAHHTLSNESQEYLKQFQNQSKVIEEALELHKNRDKIIVETRPSPLKNVRIEL